MNAQDLKNSILSLAIKGKLVEQRAEEGTAEELLKNIKAEKENLIKEGKIKKSKPLPAITEDEIPFEIPSSWEWVRLGDVGETNIGLTYQPSDKSDKGVIVLRSNNIKNGEMNYDDVVMVDCMIPERTRIYKGDLLICVRNGSRALVGKAAIVDNDGMAFGAFMAKYCSDINEYVNVFLQSPEFRSKLDGVKTETINQITQNMLRTQIMPLPPLAEQHRIVAKLEEILPYIDQYDKAYTKLEAFNKKFPEDMKKSILQMAVQGKLVEQRAEEGTAKELLKNIKAEKENLIKEGKIKKSKPLPAITEDEIPFEIPSSWEWVRFDEFGNYKKGPFGSALTKAIFVPKGEGTVKVYEQKNAIQKDASLGEYYIARDYFESKMKGFELFPGDIIVSCAGTIGETYIMPEGIEQGIINQALMRMKLMPSVYVEYFLLYFDVILKQAARKSSKGSAIKNIPPFDELKSYLVPLPPLAEQQRIVAKIEELLPYCDKLTKQ